MGWWGNKVNDMLAHIIGTGAPHTAVGVGADAAGTAAGAVDAHKDLTTGAHGVGGSTIESASGAQTKATAAQVAAEQTAGFIYWLWTTASDIGGIYKKMLVGQSAGGTQSVALTVGAPAVAWVTEASTPGACTLVAQTVQCHVHAAQTAGTKYVTLVLTVHRRASGGGESLLGTSTATQNLSAIKAIYNLQCAIPSTVLASDDRLVIKVTATPNGAGTDPTATVYYEGTDASSFVSRINNGICARTPYIVSEWSFPGGTFRGTAGYAEPTQGTVRLKVDTAEWDTTNYNYYFRGIGGAAAGVGGSMILRCWTGAWTNIASSEILLWLSATPARSSGILVAAEFAGTGVGVGWAALAIAGDGVPNNNVVYSVQIVGVPK